MAAWIEGRTDYLQDASKAKGIRVPALAVLVAALRGRVPALLVQRREKVGVNEPGVSIVADPIPRRTGEEARRHRLHALR